MGYTAVQLPPVIQRNMLENPGKVYRLYPLPARKYPKGRLGVAAQLPAGHSGSDRVGYRFRFACA
ncbi:hypothetical protein LNP74_07365 [Klebsiella pneumoniae subsp. pneumoniae]|nr:hypothetical protein [Klebsiella pneumoniae subsp. pneumoniae]